MLIASQTKTLIMITVVIHFYIKKEQVNQFKEVSIRNVSERQKAAGSVDVLFLQEEKDSKHFMLIESFDSQEKIDKYYDGWAHQQWLKEVETLIEEVSGDDFLMITAPEQLVADNR